MAVANGIHGNIISIGSEVTMSGTVQSISGTGSKAMVTTITDAGDTVVAQANDCYAPQTEGPAISICGKHFSVGDRITIMGVVTAITGTGSAATLTTSLKSSSTSVMHTASTARTPKKN
jgi:hypothetical protein